MRFGQHGRIISSPHALPDIDQVVARGAARGSRI
jgi:hypothetical protein